MSFLCARERSRSSLRFFSSVSRAFSRLNRLLVVSSAAQCVNYRAESLAMRTESRERHLMCALALVLFCSRARPAGRGQCMGLHDGKIPCKHSSAKQHRCRRSLAEKQLSFTRRSLESHVRAGSRPRLPARAQTGLQLLVQFPVTTVHTCRLRRNVQHVHIHCILSLPPSLPPRLFQTVNQKNGLS